MHLKQRIILALFAVLAAVASQGFAAGFTMSVQGRLIAQGGGPVADGNYPVAFKVYDVAKDGVALWSEFYLAAPVTGSIFALDLGTQDPKNPLDDSLFLDGKPRWIGVTVGAEPELPRAKMQRVPFAVQASEASYALGLQCSGCVGPGHLAAAAVTSDKIAVGAVLAQHVNFTYAGSDEKGGSAKFALDAAHALTADAAKSAVTATSADEANTAKTANSADKATLAEKATLADKASLAVDLQCTGCVGTADLADGAVTSAKLDKNLALTGNLTVAATALVVSSAAGRVGLGQALPTAALEIVAKPNDPLIVATGLGTTTLTADRQLQHFRLQNAAAAPFVCDASETGAVWYDTKAKAMMLCDGAAWTVAYKASSCKDPTADLTDKAYPHFGSGNCGPYFNDQSWMSANDAYQNGVFGWHDSGCPQVSGNPFCAIVFPDPPTITKLRVLMHTNPPKNCKFQGSNDTVNGSNGTWTSLYGAFDFPSGQEGQWIEYNFVNPNAYKSYRLNCPGSPGFALYEWEMMCSK